MRHKPFLLALASAAMLAAPQQAKTADGAPQAASETLLPRAIDAQYSGYLLGIKVLNASLDARLSGGEYESDALFETAGLVRWFKKAEIEAEVEGEMDRSYPRPKNYRHMNAAGSKDRTIEITFTGDDVISDVNPRFGSMGQPPATREERLEAVDALSAILQMALNANRHADRPCGYDARVFDGKQRYDLRMIYEGDYEAKLKGYKGPVTSCNVYYIPVSGFDPEDLPDEDMENTPLRVWFADTPSYGVSMPVRFELQLDFGKAVIEIRDLDIAMGDSLAGADALD